MKSGNSDGGKAAGIKGIRWDIDVFFKTTKSLLQVVLKKTNKQTQQLLKNQLSQWIAGLPSYIRAYLPNLVCQSRVINKKTPFYYE